VCDVVCLLSQPHKSTVERNCQRWVGLPAAALVERTTSRRHIIAYNSGMQAMRGLCGLGAKRGPFDGHVVLAWHLTSLAFTYASGMP
jgi:hypothetical protein